MRELHLPFGMFGVTWVTFFAAAILSFAFQMYRLRKSVSPIEFIKFAFPATGWFSKSARTDVLMYILSKILRVPLQLLHFTGGLLLANGVHEVLQALFPIGQHDPVGFAEIVLWSLLFFLIGDFANYLSHFLQHFVPVLWELHKVHHSATFLNPLTTKRMHPLGDEFDNIVASLLLAAPLGVCQWAAGLSLPEMAILSFNGNMIGTIIVLDALRHSHFPISFGPLDRIFLSPHMHQLHHSYRVEHWDKTFGNKLSIWDWMFGTMYRPAPDEDIRLGLGKAEDEDYHSFLGVYLGPLIKIGRLIRGKPSYLAPGQAAPPPAPFFDRVFWRKPSHNPRKAPPVAPERGGFSDHDGLTA